MNPNEYRRLDDIGRIVIPQEIRKHLHLESGDMLEIASEGRQVILTPYHLFSDTAAFIDICMKSIRKSNSLPLVITTKKEIYASAADDLEVNTLLSGSMRNLIAARKEYIADGSAYIPLTEEQKPGHWVLAMFPVPPFQELYGAVTLIGAKKVLPTEIQIARGRQIADLLSTAILETV